MIRKIIILMLCLSTTVCCVSCKKSEASASKSKYEKYQAEFMGLFNTYAIIIGYAESKEEFDNYANIIYNRLAELDKKYTIYDDYEGINNIRTINKMAGIEPVEVDRDIIDLLLLSKQAYEWSNGTVNIALGSVLSIWHDYRTVGKRNPDTAVLPPMEDLIDALQYTDINNVIIDEENGTVYLSDPKMSIDVGATAKGYAAYLAIEEAKRAGMNSVVANIGGNIISVGKPLDDVRQRWGIGIQDPNLDVNGVSNTLDTVYLNDATVVCSGSYERFYVVDGVEYNHIIDPETLMPAARYKSVTVLTEDASTADALSTALFIMDEETGAELAKSFNAEVLWIYYDDSMKATDGYKAVSRDMGGYSAVDKAD